MLALALLGAVSRVRGEDLLEALESGQQVARIERVPSRPGGLQHRDDVLRPEVTIGRVDLGYVAEQLRPVDLAQDIRGLQAEQTGHKELRI